MRALSQIETGSVGRGMTRRSGDVTDSRDRRKDAISDPWLPVPRIHLRPLIASPRPLCLSCNLGQQLFSPAAPC